MIKFIAALAGSIILLPHLLFAQTETIHTDWTVVTIGEATKPSFDYDTEGNIHVMAMTEDTNSGYTWHATSDRLAGPWTTNIVGRSYFYGPGDIRVDAAGNAHLAFHDHREENNRHIIVAPNGTATTTFTVTPGTHDGWDSSLAIGPQGQLHLASIFPSPFGASNSLEYGVYDGTNWTFNGSIAGSGPTMYGLNTSLAIDPQGTPHIAWCQSPDWLSFGTLRYATQDSNQNWQFANIATGDAIGRFPSLALDSSNRVHIAWLDNVVTTNLNGGVQIASSSVEYGIIDGNSLSRQSIDQLDHVVMGFNDARKSVSIALDTNDVPHIAYADRRVVKHARQIAPAQWDITTALSNTADVYNGLVVLRINPINNVPGIVFWQPQSGTKGLVRLMHPLPPAFDLILKSAGNSIDFEWNQAGDQYSYVVETNPDLTNASGWQNISGSPMDAFNWSTNASTNSINYRIRAVVP